MPVSARAAIAACSLIGAGAVIATAWTVAWTFAADAQTRAPTPPAQTTQTQTKPPPSVGLRGPSAFANISNANARSVALFNEAAKVITSPRCVNCHPAGDHALQGNAMPHDPPAPRGPDNIGVAGLHCDTCHTDKNYELIGVDTKSIPGHPRWSLAPKEMAWEGKSIRAICEQIKDEKRNGGRKLEAIHDHMAKDDLVAWGWNPGPGREPAPGSQAVFGQLIRAWIDTGARCPS
jgi:hypothetical protein